MLFGKNKKNSESIDIEAINKKILLANTIDKLGNLCVENCEENGFDANDFAILFASCLTGLSTGKCLEKGIIGNEKEVTKVRKEIAQITEMGGDTHKHAIEELDGVDNVSNRKVIITKKTF